jgi:hypothetical protein
MKRIMLAALIAGCDGAADRASLFGVTVLSETGIDDREVREFEPSYRLWSDGAEKRRFVRLPAGEVETGTLPIGGRLFKEFAVNGRPIETRVIAREGADEYFFGTFAWREDLSDADLIEDGKLNADGYEIPSNQACTLCHGSSKTKTLGWSTLQLEAAIDRTDPIAEGLGYLHANCGHCHGEGGIAMARVDMVLRLELVDGRIDSTKVLATTIDREATTGVGPEKRIAPGHPEKSAIIYRMSQLDGARMPPLGTHAIDAQGIEKVSRMIEALGQN